MFLGDWNWEIDTWGKVWNWWLVLLLGTGILELGSGTEGWPMELGTGIWNWRLLLRVDIWNLGLGGWYWGLAFGDWIWYL